MATLNNVGIFRNTKREGGGGGVGFSIVHILKLLSI